MTHVPTHGPWEAGNLFCGLHLIIGYTRFGSEDQKQDDRTGELRSSGERQGASRRFSWCNVCPRGRWLAPFCSPVGAVQPSHTRRFPELAAPRAKKTRAKKTRTKKNCRGTMCLGRKTMFRLSSFGPVGKASFGGGEGQWPGRVRRSTARSGCPARVPSRSCRSRRTAWWHQG